MDTLRPTSAPAHPLPPFACDAHAHVFGPLERFPPVGSPSYLPPPASYARYADMLAAIGAKRGVLVQPAFYGTTVDALTDALRQTKAAGHLDVRGIGVATSAVSDAELRVMHDAGVRGLRFVEMPAPDGRGRYPGSIGVDELTVLAPRLRELGWHAQLWCPIEEHAARLPDLVRLGVPLVLDHMGSLKVRAGLEAPAFQRVLGMLGDGVVWVKLTLCRNSKLFPDYADLRPFHDALVHANPSRLLWGSDWPHVRMGDLSPDVGHLSDLFHAWIDDETIRRTILVENPAALFGFATLENPHA